MILDKMNDALKMQPGAWAIKACAALAVISIISATALTIALADQPLLDIFNSFRQTQTALTSYWFQREGYQLAYLTPVGGYPWAIPFEFPLYQAIVAAVSQGLGMSIGTVGRLVSFAFLLASVPVVWSINRTLSMPPLVFYCFVALAFSTPVYIYYGRALLIETTALFFVLLATKFFLDYLLKGRSLGRALLFSVFMTLCMLQKVTTGLPVLVILVTLLCVEEFRSLWSTRKVSIAKWGALVVLLVLPVAISYVWTQYTDAVKQHNPFGEVLTSAALSSWNWGNLEQRLSSDLWYKVIINRVLTDNLGGLLGVAIISGSFLFEVQARIKVAIMIALVMGLLPMFMFPNLHIIHGYYQSSNLIFFVYALALALGAVFATRSGSLTALILLIVLIVTNYSALERTGYYHAMTETFGKEDRNISIGEILKHELPVDGQFVAFGNDWSSTFAYQSERKSFTVPMWFKDYDDVIAHPGEYVEKGHLGAVVACSDRPGLHQILDWADLQGGWKVGEAAGCAIAVPESRIPSELEPGKCEGSIDTADIAKRDGHSIITLAGWSATTTGPASAPDQIVLALTRSGKPTQYFDTLRVPRLDVNSALGLGEQSDIGFSRLLSARHLSGQYKVELVQIINGRGFICPISRTLTLP